MGNHDLYLIIPVLITMMDIAKGVQTQETSGNIAS